MDLLSIDSLSDGQIAAILDAGERFADANGNGIASPQSLAGRIVFNLFFENSTRTLMSFAVAAHRLGAQVDAAIDQLRALADHLALAPVIFLDPDRAMPLIAGRLGGGAVVDDIGAVALPVD